MGKTKAQIAAELEVTYLGTKSEQLAKKHVDENCLFTNHEQWLEDIKTFAAGYNTAIQSQSVQPIGSVREIAIREYSKTTLDTDKTGLAWSIWKRAYDSAAANLPVVGWSDEDMLEYAKRANYHAIGDKGRKDILADYKKSKALDKEE